MTNSTLSGNGGLAVETYNGAVISNSTEGSGADINNNGGVVAIENTVLKIGASGQSIVNSGGDVKSLGYNLSSDDGGGYLNGLGDQINIDPFLGPLAGQWRTYISHTRCCLVAWPSMPVIRISFLRLIMISAAQIMIA